MRNGGTEGQRDGGMEEWRNGGMGMEAVQRGNIENLNSVVRRKRKGIEEI
jgi:hypothetical protein